MTAQTLPKADAEEPSDSTALRDVLVTGVRLESDGVVSVQLEDPSGAPLPSWAPGSHVDVVLPSGNVRQYSLCGSPGPGYRIAVLREGEGRGGSIEVHDTALVGRRLKIRGPRNHFRLEPAPAYLFVAGGIGVTPILSMVASLPADADYRVLYGGRTRRSMAFVDELVRHAGEERVRIAPQDEVGLLDLPGALAEVPEGAVVYCCGPGPLLDAVQSAAAECETVREVHVERFTAAPSDATQTDQISDGAATGFEVELASTGEVLHVGPEDILIDVVREVRPELMSSCEEGFCGTCETKVLAGEPEHHDTILSEREREAGKTMMICVGRCKSARLVLDL